MTKDVSTTYPRDGCLLSGQKSFPIHYYTPIKTIKNGKETSEAIHGVAVQENPKSFRSQAQKAKQESSKSNEGRQRPQDFFGTYGPREI